MVRRERNIASAARQAALGAFGKRLQQARNFIGFTQETVSEKLGVSTQTVRNWEAGRTEPRRADKDRLSDLYEVSIEWLLDEEATVDNGQDSEPSIEAARELVMNEAFIALRSASEDLSDEAIRSIAKFIRFVHDEERREGQERGREATP